MKFDELKASYVKAWKNSFEYNGRSDRRDFWYFALANGIVAIILAIASGIVFERFPNPIYSLYGFASFFPGLALAVRRLHDTGRSGKCLLKYIGVYVVGAIIMVMCAESAPVVSGLVALAILGLSIYVIVLFAQKSQIGYNQYGADPNVEAAGNGK